jgi:hypothetical protein
MAAAAHAARFATCNVCSWSSEYALRLSLLLVVAVITRSVRNKAYCVLSISRTSKTVCDEYSSEIHHYQVNSTTAVNYNHTVLGKTQTDSDSTTRLDMDSENGFHIDQATIVQMDYQITTPHRHLENNLGVQNFDFIFLRGRYSTS